MERLQKVIAQSGLTSRRKAEQLIKEGKVKVNGKQITELGMKVSSKDKVEVNNKPIEKEQKEYYILNKPRGVVTTTHDEHGRKTVLDFIPTTARIYPVGRLDYDTTGLLLLTNDGEFANILMHPNEKVEKVYIAKINGIIKGEQINKLKEGVEVDGIKVSASRVKLKKVNNKNNTCMVQITIHEGKNHQVKKMFESVGFQVEKLKREKVAFFNLKDLQSGQYRKLTPKEVAKVYALEQ
ncbi:MAG TPA: rRNA pseudouridine synthase [Candidatus Faecimonas gallistercoris]|nr:rRNA pseudouridine synthase [Candidatus Faecimonas gallistercoris]